MQGGSYERYNWTQLWVEQTMTHSSWYCKYMKKITLREKNGFIHVDALRSTTMPLGFVKASIKTWKNNECFFREPFQGVPPSSLISWEVTSMKLYKKSIIQIHIIYSRSLSIFIWQSKSIRFHPEVLWKERTSKSAVDLTICKSNENKIK